MPCSLCCVVSESSHAPVLQVAGWHLPVIRLAPEARLVKLLVTGLPALLAGLRIGLYTPLKRLMGAEGHESALLRKVAAGMLSGALAAGICNPTDLVKTRMQVRGSARVIAVCSCPLRVFFSGSLV